MVPFQMMFHIHGAHQHSEVRRIASDLAGALWHNIPRPIWEKAQIKRLELSIGAGGNLAEALAPAGNSIGPEGRIRAIDGKTSLSPEDGASWGVYSNNCLFMRAGSLDTASLNASVALTALHEHIHFAFDGLKSYSRVLKGTLNAQIFQQDRRRAMEIIETNPNTADAFSALAFPELYSDPVVNTHTQEYRSAWVIYWVLGPFIEEARVEEGYQKTAYYTINQRLEEALARLMEVSVTHFDPAWISRFNGSLGENYTPGEVSAAFIEHFPKGARELFPNLAMMLGAEVLPAVVTECAALQRGGVGVGGGKRDR